MTLTEFVDNLHEGIDSFWAWRHWMAQTHPEQYPIELPDKRAWKDAFFSWNQAGRPKEPSA